MFLLRGSKDGVCAGRGPRPAALGGGASRRVLLRVGPWALCLDGFDRPMAFPVGDAARVRVWGTATVSGGILRPREQPCPDCLGLDDHLSCDPRPCPFCGGEGVVRAPCFFLILTRRA